VLQTHQQFGQSTTLSLKLWYPNVLVN